MVDTPYIDFVQSVHVRNRVEGDRAGGDDPGDRRYCLSVPENKYTFQVGLKDLDFDVDQDQLTTAGISLPFRNIDQAEHALSTGVITPTLLIEDDDTRHQVLVFDHHPVGYSGFMGCVTHSLALTDFGLFEIGRYPAVSLASHSRYWQWFLHRRLATPEEIHNIQETYGWDHRELLQRAITALTGLDDASYQFVHGEI